MNNKTKEYLQQIYIARNKINRLQQARDTLREQMYSLSSPSGNMTPDKVQSSMTGDKIDNLIAQVDEMERDIVMRQEYWFNLYRKITKQIERMPTEKYRKVLWLRYVLCHSWEVIPREIDRDPRYTYRLHGEALLEFEKVNKITSE